MLNPLPCHSDTLYSDIITLVNLNVFCILRFSTLHVSDGKPTSQRTQGAV
jgi:hypothetical protein